MLTRRGLVGVFLAAPVIIRTPGLLMPIKPFVLEPVTNPPTPTAEPVWVSEALWRVEIVTDGAGVITGTKLYYDGKGPLNIPAKSGSYVLKAPVHDR
jgi:hypothetical protein